MHIPYEAQVVLVARRLAYGLPPFFYELENLVLHSRRVDRRTFGKAADKFVEEFLGTDLEVERIAAILDTYVEEVEREEGDILIAVIDIVYNCDSRFSGRCAFLTIDQVGDLEIQGQIGLKVLRVTCLQYIALQL